MRWKPTQEELAEILRKHELWLEDKDGGERAILGRANLRGANLFRANLSRADLERANLIGANLSRADLERANLIGANLERANLGGANLSRADLERANLIGANLERANLGGANLSRAGLEGADLRGANLDFSCLPLWCGSKDMIVDDRIAQQIAAHFCALTCDSEEYQQAREALLPYARKSHVAYWLLDDESEEKDD